MTLKNKTNIQKISKKLKEKNKERRKRLSAKQIRGDVTLNEMKEKNINQSESEIKKEMVNMVYGNMLKEKDSDIFQLNLKIEGLESKLARNAKVNQNYENTIEEYKVNVLLLQSIKLVKIF